MLQLKHTPVRFSFFCLWIVTLTLSLPTITVALNLNGEGSSFAYSVYEQWGISYRSSRFKFKDVEVNYKSVGSTVGMDAIMNRPRDVDFAGSESPLSQYQKERKPDLVAFPTLAGGIVLAYNLPTCSSRNGQRLNLSRDHVVGIYNGTYNMWSDISIQTINVNCTLPNATIVVIARRIQSGTTDVFTTALSAFDERWASTKGTFSSGVYDQTDIPVQWDPDVIRYYGPTNQDMTGLIRSVQYSVGYLSLGDALNAEVDFAALGNRQGQYITANQESLQDAMNAKVNETSLTPKLVDPTLPKAYPIACYTYFTIYKTEMSNCEKATELLRYITWFMTSHSARKAAEIKGFAALSPQMVDRVQREILDNVTCRGRYVMNSVHDEIQEEGMVQEAWVIPAAVTVPLFLVVVGILFGYILFQRMKLNKMVNTDDWNIPMEEIVFFYDEKMHLASSGRSRYLGHKSINTLKSLGEISEGSELLKQILQWPGKWKANIIGIRLLEIKELRTTTRDMKKAMIWMRDSIINTNIVRFYGLTELEKDRYVIGDYCSKGTILDVLQNDKYNLNTDFQLSVAAEISSGMAFLHAHGMVHGMLTSSCCMLDNKWTVKIGDWEFCRLLSLLNPMKSPLLVMKARRQSTEESQYEHVLRDFWVAPETLRSDFSQWPSPAGDVYSYSIILQELFTRDDPYFEFADYMTPEQIRQAIIHNRLRPEPSPDAPVTIRQIMELSWSDAPSARPTFDQISKMVKRGRTGRKTVMDIMMEAMEDYAAHLEEEVQAKESALQAVQNELDKILSEMVPWKILNAFRSRERVEPIVYSSLGIVVMEVVDSYSNVGIDISANILAFFGTLNEQISKIVKKYQAYCPRSHYYCTQTFVLGLEEDSAGETLVNRCHRVAHLALDILEVVPIKKQLHKEGSPISIRLGAHVGEVATGTIGVTFPRLLLWGRGMDICHALAANAQVNTVRISRSLICHLQKSPDFMFSAKDPEWIPCKGTDIESFVLIGHHAEPLTVTSDLSMDSGIDMEHASLKIRQQDTQLNPCQSNCAKGKPVFSTANLILESFDWRTKDTKGDPETNRPIHKRHRNLDGQPTFEPSDGQSQIDASNKQPQFIASNVQSQIGAFNRQPQFVASNVQSQIDTSNVQSQIDASNGQSQIDTSNVQSQIDTSNGQSQIDTSNGQSQIDTSNVQSQIDTSNVQSQIDTSNVQSQIDTSNGQSQIETSNGQSHFNASNGQPQFDQSNAQPQFYPSNGQLQYYPSNGQPQFDPYDSPLQFVPFKAQHQFDSSNIQPQIDPSNTHNSIATSNEQHQYVPSNTQQQFYLVNSQHQSLAIADITESSDVSNTNAEHRIYDQQEVPINSSIQRPNGAVMIKGRSEFVLRYTDIFNTSDSQAICENPSISLTNPKTSSPVSTEFQPPAYLVSRLNKLKENVCEHRDKQIQSDEAGMSGSSSSFNFRNISNDREGEGRSHSLDLSSAFAEYEIDAASDALNVRSQVNIMQIDACEVQAQSEEGDKYACIMNLNSLKDVTGHNVLNNIYFDHQKVHWKKSVKTSQDLKVQDKAFIKTSVRTNKVHPEG